MRLLWGGSEPLLYGTIPWKWVFDSVDLILIVIFTALGARDCYLELKG